MAQANAVSLPLFTNNAVMQHALALPPYISRIACGRVNYRALSEARLGEQEVIDIIGVYCKGNWLRDNHHIPERYTGNVEKELLCGEYGSIINAATQDQSRAWFLTAIRYYIYYTDEAQQLEADPNPQIGFQVGDGENDHGTIHQGLVGAEEYIHDGNELTRFPTTFEEAYEYAVNEGAHRRAGGVHLDVTSTVVTSLVSIIKRGNITPEAIDKIQENCNVQIGKKVVIPEQIVKSHYSLYTPAMTPDNIRRVVNRLLEIVPVGAIKIRTMVQQSAYSGLSSYVCVKDAIAKFADFRWGVVEALHPGQFRAYHDALITIGGNQYYAFRHGAMGNAASTKYAILGWTARSLLIESGEQPELKKYAGAYKRNKYPRIAAAIHTYVNRPLAVNEDGAANNPDHAFWNNCRQFMAGARDWVVQAEAAVEDNQPVPPLVFNELGEIPEVLVP